MARLHATDHALRRASHARGIGTEIRRRLNRAFLEEGIELNKRGVAPRVARSGRQPTPPYVADPGDE